MDPSLAALLGAVVGGLFTLSGSIFASFIQSRKERDRWIRDEKRKIYLSLIELTDKIYNESMNRTVDREDELFEKFYLRLAELEVFASPKSLGELQKALDEFEDPVQFSLLKEIVIREAKSDLGIGH